MAPAFAGAGFAAAAWQIVGWYQLRWVIEQLFRVMKSQGLRLEDSQMATAERLVKLAAVAVKAACIDIQLTQERDGKHRLPGSTVFSEPEMDTIEALVPTLEGNTDRQKNPHPARSLAWATWVVARPRPRLRRGRFWAVGTAAISRQGRSPSGGGWSSSMPSIAAECSK